MHTTTTANNAATAQDQTILNSTIYRPFIKAVIDRNAKHALNARQWCPFSIGFALRQAETRK